MNIKYRVTLTTNERKELKQLINHGRIAGYRIKHAQILLALDETPENMQWTDKKIADAYQCCEKTIGDLRKRFVEQGLNAALERKKREIPPRIKIDGETEAKIIALTCSKAPDGYERWTLRLLAEKVVALEIMESVSHTAIADCLKKTKLNHGYNRHGVFHNCLRNL
jgi:transposase